MKKQLILLLAAASLLTSCGASSGGESLTPPTPFSSSIDEDVDTTVIEDLSDISSGISVSSSGFLNDISVGMSLAGHSSYAITFSLNDNSTGVVNVRSDNENVLTIDKSSSGTTWTILTHKQGKAHLIIEDGDTIVHFRKLVTVKKKLSQEEVAASLLETDHYKTVTAFESYTGKMTMFFLDDEGYISGNESGGVSLNNESFSYAYDKTYTDIAEDHDNWYIYKVSNWQLTDFVFDYFAVWNTGDRIHAHTRNALLGIFEPAEEL